MDLMGQKSKQIDRELLEQKKDRRATYVLAAATALGPSLGALIAWFLSTL